jgi:hypothetical protein
VASILPEMARARNTHVTMEVPKNSELRVTCPEIVYLFGVPMGRVLNLKIANM